MDATVIRRTNNIKAKKRPGPWLPIEPTITPCKTYYVSAIGADFLMGDRPWPYTMPVNTPRQRCKRGGDL